MKRSYYILGIIATIALVVGIFYFLRYRSQTATPGGATSGTENVGLPPAPTQSDTSAAQTPTLPGTKTGTGGTGANAPRQKFGLVAQNRVLDYFLYNQNEAVIVQPDGQIVKIASAGQSVLSSIAIAGLADAEFSYDGAEILASFGNFPTLQESVFNVSGKSWQPLGAGIGPLAWSPNDSRFAYLNNKNGSRVLTTTDITNPKPKPVELLSIRAEDVNLYWPLPDKIIISDKPSSAVPGSVWSFDVKQKTLAQIGNALGIESIWARGADLGLVFYAGQGGYGGNLTIRNTRGRAINSLAILTLPSKCVFDVHPAQASSTKTTASAASSSGTTAPEPDYLYCAIPRDANELRAASIPDDYEMKKFLTSDDFYRINLADGNLEQVFSDRSRNLDATNPKIFNDYLLFINRYDQKLYWIALK